MTATLVSYIFHIEFDGLIQNTSYIILNSFFHKKKNVFLLPLSDYYVC